MRSNENWNDRDFRGEDMRSIGYRNRGIRDVERHEDPDAIEADIRRTRVEMDQTLDELIRRLEPGRIVGEVWHAIRNRAGSAGDGAAHLASSAARTAGAGIARQVVRHPLPSALIGAGLAWLVTEEARRGSRRQGRGYDEYDISSRYGEGPMRTRNEEYVRGYAGYNPSAYVPGYEASYEARYEESDVGRRHQGGVLRRAGDVGRRVGHTAERAAHSVADVAERSVHAVTDAAREVGDRASTTVHRASSGIETASRQVSRTANTAARNIAENTSEAYERYPLGVALAAMGAGLLAGMAIPNTRRENRLMGERSRRLRQDAIDAARERASGALETGAERVTQAVGSAAERAGQAVAGSSRGGSESSGYAQEHRESGEGRRQQGQSSAETCDPGV